MNLSKTEYFFYAPIIGESDEAAKTADMMNEEVKDCVSRDTYGLKEMEDYLARMKLCLPGIHTDGIRINSRTC